VSVPGVAAPLYTVSQAAAMLEMQPAFLRRLDTEGVVIPARTVGGQRRYSHDDVNHIAALAALMGEGLTLAGAQRIIELENEVAVLRLKLAAIESNTHEPAASDGSIGEGVPNRRTPEPRSST
jgi:DNA-binding transcriptional MerR regulator